MEFFSPRFFLLMATLVAALSAIKSRGGRRWTITVASCLFYAAWDWRYLGLLLLVSQIDFYTAGRIHQATRSTRRRAWVFMSVFSNLAILGYFKYADFALELFNRWAGEPVPLLHIIAPIGISFYTFKSLSYTIDVYRGILQPCQRWADYIMFVTFFPDLIAGPIVRASSFLPQIERVGCLRFRDAVIGGNIFVQGLTKKMLVADRLGEIANPIFTTPQVFSTGWVWIGMLAFTGQIYCDFSGYSDMAVGTAKVLGYDLPMNFDLPYASRSIAEFWRRWHMTLGAWLRDYLYISIGGSRRGSLRTYRNLFLTMLIAGLWHGAALHFVAWGSLHGVALCLQRWWGRWRKPEQLSQVSEYAGWFLTLSFVTLTFPAFRCADGENLAAFYLRLLARGGWHGQTMQPLWFMVCLCVILIGHAVALRIRGDVVFPGTALSEWFGLEVVDLPLAGRYLCITGPTVLAAYTLTMWLGLLFFFCATQGYPFIYFQF